MHEREAMATEIGSLRGEVQALRGQVEMLVTLIKTQQPALLAQAVIEALPHVDASADEVKA